jgi:serpin B
LSDFGQEFGKLLRSSQGAKEYKLAIANRLWGQRGFDFQADFLKSTEREFGAPLEQVDFKTAEAVRIDINKWVAEHTHDKIRDLLPQGAVDELTSLVLTNAIYFKGTWEQQFESRLTRAEPFFIDATASVNVPLMRRLCGVGYRKLEGGQIVELPYQGGDLSMVVLLPDAREGLAVLEPKLSEAQLTSWLEAIPQTEVFLLLPKFLMKTTLDLRDALSKMGIRKAFSDEADFSQYRQRAETVDLRSVPRSLRRGR